MPELQDASVSTIFPHDSIVPVLVIWPIAVNVSVPLTVRVEETFRMALPEVILVVTLLNTVEPGVIVPPLAVIMRVPLLWLNVPPEIVLVPVHVVLLAVAVYTPPERVKMPL